MDLSKYLESMKNLPERFSNLAFWRGVRNLNNEIANTFSHIQDWGTGIEGQINRLKLRLNNSFTVDDHTINVTGPSNLYKIDQGVPESSVPYPRVDNYMLIFTISNLSNTNADIIESAAFDGTLAINNRRVTFNNPMPLIPVINGSTMYLIFYPLPMYMENSNYSIENGNMTLYIRSRRIATE